MPEFKIGDTVKLKSGGPDMTVDGFHKAVGGDDEASCTWFDDNKEPQGRAFLPDTLERVEAGPSMA